MFVTFWVDVEHFVAANKLHTMLQYESGSLFAPLRVQVEEVEVNITNQSN